MAALQPISTAPTELQDVAPIEGGSTRELTFQGAIRNADGTVSASLQLAIQYYNTIAQGWETLLSNFGLTNGAFEAKYQYLVGGAPPDATANRISNVIHVGGFPMVRLVLSATLLNASPDVLAFGGIVYPNGGVWDDLVLNFGELRLLSPSRIDQQIDGNQTNYEYAQVAVPFSDSVDPLLSSGGGAELSSLADPDSIDGGGGDVIDDIDGGGGGPVDNGGGGGVNGGNDETNGGDSLGDFNEFPDEQRYTLYTELIAQQKVQIASLSDQLSVQTDLNSTLNEQVTAKDTEIATLSGQIQTQNTAKPVNEVYTQLIQEVDTASQGNFENYTLGNVSIDLKTFVSQDQDGNFQLQSVDSAGANNTNQETVSQVKFDINRNPAVKPSSSAAITPSVMGLTETAARKRLQAQGMKLVAIYQASDKNTVGQAFKQTPAAGEDSNRDLKVTVIFAKGEGQFA
ncbi:MAG TPA: hypothetical protein DCR93_00255 [Cytophagales bacterium]|nr:hypothetical protein [Cytophagales bacterium]HAP57997.1 hypothetical protein [Cytophagales bacterium]